MVPKAVALFLFAVTVASGRITQGSKSHPHQMVLMPILSSGCPSAMEPAPLICKFMRPDIELHYKPQLIAPSTYIPPLVVEKCDSPQMEIDIPAPTKKPTVIPRAPVLPPITIPKFPVPVIVEKPMLPSVPVVEPCEPAFIQETPAKDIPLAPELPPITIPVLPENIEKLESTFDEVVVPEISYQPMVVPQPPGLPAIVMSDIPVRVEMPVPEPCLEDEPIRVAPTPEYIPPAPMPLPIVEHAFVQEAAITNIPVAPELPPFEMPALPEFEPEPVVPETHQLLAAPQPPQLPAFVMPELPVRVETPLPEPCLEDQLTPIAPMPEYIPLPAPKPLPIAEPNKPVFVSSIPMAPALPPFKMPALPEIEVRPEPLAPFKPIVVSQTPELPALMMPELPTRGEPLPIAPCPEDQLPVVSIPEYIQPLAPMPVPSETPEVSKASLSEIPVRIEFPYQPISSPMNKPDPCIIGDIALIAPQLPELPKPVAMPAMPVDPCEPSSKSVMKMADLPPYFVSYIPTVPRNFGYYSDYLNNLPTIGAVPYNMGHIYK